MTNSVIPDGHYAVHAPDDHGQITYWRISTKGRSHGLKPWPAKASYGPVLLVQDIPQELRGQQRQDWVTRWTAEVHRPWHTAIRDAITTDLAGAAKRFADLTTRCCCCGRSLTDEYSKCVGIGPDCRSGTDPADLARYLTPQVCRAHAAHLAHHTEETS